MYFYWMIRYRLVDPGLAKEIMVEGHDGKSAADQDGIDPADDVDGRAVFFVCDTEGLERALETMDQVYGQGEYADEVYDHHPGFLEGYVDATVDILYGFVVARVGDHGKLVCKAHLDPEVAHVEAEEGEDEDAEQGHILRGPGSTRDFAFGVFAAFGLAIHDGQGDSLEGVQEDKRVQAYRDHPDEGVFGHEGRVDIEGPAPVVGEELEVAGHVDDEEEDQEDAGEAHDHFLAERGGEETG